MREMNPPKLITIQGSARGGKGTLARALQENLAQDYRVHKIDQGLKFRILAITALGAGINKEDLDALAAFIALASTRKIVADRLIEASAWTKAQLEERYYSEAISNASGMVGKLENAHDVAVQLLLEEVRAVAEHFDIILIDGRALQKYGELLEESGIVEYILAIDVHCDAFVSAQRETKIFAPEDGQTEHYTLEQTMKLLIATRDIARRNSSDARRERDPSLPIRGAYDFDVLHDLNETEQKVVYEIIAQNGAIAIDNSNTKTPESMTDPVVYLVRWMLTKDN